jgi:hypothetical protein
VDRGGLTVDLRRLDTAGKRTWSLVDSLSNHSSDNDTDRLPELLTLVEETLLGLVLFRQRVSNPLLPEL